MTPVFGVYITQAWAVLVEMWIHELGDVDTPRNSLCRSCQLSSEPLPSSPQPGELPEVVVVKRQRIRSLLRRVPGAETPNWCNFGVVAETKSGLLCDLLV